MLIRKPVNPKEEFRRNFALAARGQYSASRKAELTASIQETQDDVDALLAKGAGISVVEAAVLLAKERQMAEMLERLEKFNDTAPIL